MGFSLLPDEGADGVDGGPELEVGEPVLGDVDVPVVDEGVPHHGGELGRVGEVLEVDDPVGLGRLDHRVGGTGGENREEDDAGGKEEND